MENLEYLFYLLASQIIGAGSDKDIVAKFYKPSAVDLVRIYIAITM